MTKRNTNETRPATQGKTIIPPYLKKKQADADKQLKTILEKSDARIRKARWILEDSDRGRKTLVALKSFMEGAASGLDSVGTRAMLTLVEEFCKNHRRGFIL